MRNFIFEIFLQTSVSIPELLFIAIIFQIT